MKLKLHEFYDINSYIHFFLELGSILPIATSDLLYFKKVERKGVNIYFFVYTK